MNVDQVLMQMRVMAAQAKGIQDVSQVEAKGGADFSDMLVKSINAVNESQQASGDLKKRFEMGDQSVNMVDVAVASEKAKIAYTAMSEVRNKLIKAYQDIMSMPV
ncbi:flagellar hook-basal body protein FliE [Candidatus Tenderia electrophaga]|jgi:flagellar hook-basal body complex protein FliE|uniref:Flagellar hook-basal body complex protein FliE n=1 Tax=Candidatus Tenderia electrophaga TaxID=1748243 RepID=A0A0S2TBY2_9GAMM|nr:flagellar hook-basal body protein FliE [Candidatus Tenderia electrophaga]